MTEPESMDYTIIGCAFCKRHTDDEPLPYSLPPPFTSLDARVDARLHAECYWKIVNVVRAALGALPVVQDLDSPVDRLYPYSHRPMKNGETPS